VGQKIEIVIGQRFQEQVNVVNLDLSLNPGPKVFVESWTTGFCGQKTLPGKTDRFSGNLTLQICATV
jgi:hypothetical protein